MEETDNQLLITCSICKNKFPESSILCDSPPLCAACARNMMEDVIECYCVESTSTDPMAMALDIMSKGDMAVHGPHHHFLVPAVLLSAYYNKKKMEECKIEKIKAARERALHILGGFCGTHGDCGAAVGAGIFISIITGATPFSEDVWHYGIALTGKTLVEIGTCHGPRCCKRNTFIAIQNATCYLKEEFGIQLDTTSVGSCTYVTENQECIFEDCPFI